MESSSGRAFGILLAVLLIFGMLAFGYACGRLYLRSARMYDGTELVGSHSSEGGEGYEPERRGDVGIYPI